MHTPSQILTAFKEGLRHSEEHALSTIYNLGVTAGKEAAKLEAEDKAASTPAPSPAPPPPAPASAAEPTASGEEKASP
jgi:hypothetical protein